MGTRLIVRAASVPFGRGDRLLARSRSLAFALLLVAGCGVHAAGDRVVVFAAASTTEALNEVAAAFEARSGTRVVASFAASSVLARQIAAGAPADLFLSANPAWMDRLEESGMLVPGTRRDLLGNALVMVAPAAESRSVVLAPGLRIDGLLAGGPLAIADPDHVPAGIYAKAALEHFGLWSAVERRAARAPNVRAAKALVARGESSLGIGYLTDSAPFEDLRVLATFPSDSHPAIVYPCAIVKGNDTVTVRDFYMFLNSREASEVFRRHGFLAP